MAEQENKNNNMSQYSATDIDGEEITIEKSQEIINETEKVDPTPHVFMEKSSEEVDNNILLLMRKQKASVYAVPQEMFNLPEQCDFYLGAVDSAYLKKLNDQLKEDISEPEDWAAKNAAFYTEAPASTDPENADKTYWIHAKISMDQNLIERGWLTPTRLCAPIQNITIDAKKPTFRQIFNQDDGTPKLLQLGGADYFFFNMYGITCPSPAIWAEDKNLDIKKIQLQSKKYSEAKQLDKFIGTVGVHDDDEVINVAFISNAWREVIIHEEGSNFEKVSLQWVYKPNDQGYNRANSQKLLETMIDVISKESDDGEVYFLIDRKGIPASYGASSVYNTSPDPLVELRDMSDDPFKHGAKNGLCLFRSDLYANLSGVAYIKKGNAWINLAKFMLSYKGASDGGDEMAKELRYNNEYSGENADIFKNNYDRNSLFYADAFFETVDEIDDRPEIQKQIFGRDWDYLKNWTVTIGDTTLFIPPTNISMTSTIQDERLPLLRAKGSMSKNGKRTIRQIQMEVYFNNAEGVNGYSYEVESPNKEHKFIYSMNGLRALISQFKFTPFLPIENKFFNDVLGIYAVTFNNLQVSNVDPQLPRLLRATISMCEFNYEVYMPQLVLMLHNADDDWIKNHNPFSTAFNWPTMRYYYQRPLMLGDYMRTVNKPMNSKEYIDATLKYNRTALQPMQFKDNSMKLYIADRNCLDRLLQQLIANETGRKTTYSDNNRNIIKEFGRLGRALFNKMESAEFASSLQEVNDGGSKDQTIVYDINKELIHFWHHTGIKDKTNLKYKNGSEDFETNAQNLMDSLKTAVTKAEGASFKGQLPYPSVENNLDAESANSYEFVMSLNIPLSSYKNIEQLINSSEKKDAFYGEVVSRSYLNQSMGPSGLDYSNNSTIDKLKNELDISSSSNLKINFKLKMKRITDKQGNTIGWEQDGKDGFILDNQTPDLRLLLFCMEEDDRLKAEEAALEKEKEANDLDASNPWKQSLLNSMYSNIDFAPLNLGVFYITNFSAALSNRISNVNISNSEGSSPQYLGGEDIRFEVSIKTRDKVAVSIFSELLQMTSYIMRTYRKVIPSCPLRIDSEFTRLFGVTDVIIDNVIINTVPKQPGLYDIGLSMTSYDRTIRNKESLKMLEAKNGGEKYTNAYGAQTIKTYFDLEKTISEAELYPDLELPRIEEMSDLGWEFIRYKFQDFRVYVDPDFYFVYLNQLQSQFLRECILNSINCGVDGRMTIVDGQDPSSQAQLVPTAFKGYTYTNLSDGSQSLMDRLNNQNKAINNISEETFKENIKTLENPVTNDKFEGWDICPDIRAYFFEKQYLDQLNEFTLEMRNKQANQQSTGYDENGEPVQSTETEGQDSNENNENNESNENNEDKKDKENNEASENQEKKNQSSNEGNETTDEQSKEKQDGEQSNSTAEQAASKKKGIKYRQGEFVYNQLKDAREAAKMITAYLKEHPIEVSTTSTTATSKIHKMVKEGKISEAINSMASDIENTTLKFLEDSDIKRILEIVPIAYDEQFKNTTKNIVYAAACAATGNKEYSEKKNSNDWKPDPRYYGVIALGGTDSKGQRQAKDPEEAIFAGQVFGCFAIKFFSVEELVQVTGDKDPRVEKEELKDRTSYLLDPYYRYASDSEVQEYRKSCVNSVEYCTKAYLRNVLYWLGKLIELNIFPAMGADIFRKATDAELSNYQSQQAHGVADNSVKGIVKNIDFFKKNSHSIDAGKMWVACCMATMDGSSTILNRIKSRDYRALNEYVHGAQVPSLNPNSNNGARMAIRKMCLALKGKEVIKDTDATGVNQSDQAIRDARDITEMKYIEAAEDPKIYMLHSCHDMIVHDARGRMLRAFPTYYMLFIDEGRDSGKYHLHDNFYNSMCILEMDIIKSRKIPADTANITMSNIYQTYTTEAIIPKLDPVGFRDVYNSIFNPVDYGKKLDQKRYQKDPETRLRIRPGARIHLRMGYGSNAAMLPPVFNGTVAEVNAQEVLNIVAQGDGIELMNPIMEDVRAHKVASGSNNQYTRWTITEKFSSGDTPGNIMRRLFLAEGSWFRNVTRAFGKDDWFGDNPFGICHFGTKEYDEIIATGEPTQNIFEAWQYPSWGTFKEKNSSFIDGGAPHITTDLLQKTVWDVGNICRSVMPDFICAVVPFGMRSTFFMGAPRYYYAYDYIQVNGAIHEKRKPFQQYHIYTSETDIIANGIEASDQQIKTTAVGLYDNTDGSVSSAKKVGPLFVDIDIYPENQKSMVVQTHYIGDAVPSFINYMSDEEGRFTNNEAIAWRMTAAALKDSMKDMYCGDIVVMGDPSVKPHDRIFIDDKVEEIGGQVTVKEVVHHMSIESGFITTISPDLISVVDDRFEMISNNWFTNTSVLMGSFTISLAHTVRALLFNHAITAQEVISNTAGWTTFRNYMSNTALGIKASAWLEKGGISAAGKISKVANGQTAAKVASMIKTLSKGGAKAIKSGVSLLTTGLVGGAALVSGGWVVAAAVFAAKVLIGQIIGSYVNQLIRNYTKSLQVLTVFPLLHHGIAWTAGLDGSKGLIYRSYSYNEQGWLQTLINDVCGHSDNPVIEFVKGMFLDDETMDIAGQHMNNYDPAYDPNRMQRERQADLTMRRLSMYSGGMNDKTGTNGRILKMLPLTNYEDKQQVVTAINKYGVNFSPKFWNDPKLQNMIVIEDDPTLKKYMTTSETGEDFFRVAHMDPGLLADGQKIEEFNIEFQGEKKRIKAIIDTRDYEMSGDDPFHPEIKTEKATREIYDLPLLAQPAIAVLGEIVRRAKYNMLDSTHNEQSGKVVLDSALRIGDQDGFMNTGYSFIIRGLGDAVNPLAKAINEYAQEIEDDHELNPEMNKQIFGSSTQGLDEGRIFVHVYMPRLTAASSLDALQEEEEN